MYHYCELSSDARSNDQILTKWRYASFDFKLLEKRTAVT
jgi:hypothetical protein